MANQLPPPPTSGSPIDNWLFLLWKRVTASLTSIGLIDNATTAALTLSGGGTNSVVITNSNTDPTISTTANNILLEPASGVIRSLSNVAGAKYFQMRNFDSGAGSSTQNIVTSDDGAIVLQKSSTAGGGLTYLYASGSSPFSIYTISNQPLQLGANNGFGLQVLNSAGATRFVTVTGTNGGNPQIGTSAGDIDLTSNIVNAPAYSNTSANAPNLYIDSNGKHYRSTFAVGGAVGGTVTSVGLAVPTGMSVSGTPVTGAGTITISLADDLSAVEAISTTGFVKRTALNTWTTATAIDLTADVTGDLPVTNLAGGTLDQGYSTTPYNAGTKSSGTFTPSETNGNFQYCVNGGAFTLAPPTNNCTLVLQITNNGSAGAITTSGFTKVSGSPPTTTNGDDFLAFITKINGFSHLSWQELQ